MKEKFPPLHVLFPPMARPVNRSERSPQRDGGRNARVGIDGADRRPLPFFSYGARVKLIDKIKLAIDADRSNRRAESRTLSPAELHRLYAGTLVPQHRYLSTALTEAVNSPEIGPHPSKWLGDVSGIDLSKVVDAWLNTNRSTEFERLYCIGLDQDTGQLTAVLTVKRGSGYSGGPRTAGSKEYVAFWVDWGWGFRYEGTASVTVHDFGWLPSAGLEYTVSLPVNLLSRTEPGRDGGKTVKVRAVLSWNTPPSTTDPNAPVVWGNILECRILIPSSQEAQADNRSHCLTAAGSAKANEIGIDGQIVDAAIRALKGTAFGSNTGLTVVSGGAIPESGVTDWSFTIKANDIHDSGNTFTLHVWNRNGMNRDETLNLDNSPAGLCTRTKS